MDFFFNYYTAAVVVAAADCYSGIVITSHRSVSCSRVLRFVTFNTVEFSSIQFFICWFFSKVLSALVQEGEEGVGGEESERVEMHDRITETFQFIVFYFQYQIFKDEKHKMLLSVTKLYLVCVSVCVNSIHTHTNMKMVHGL